MLFRSQRQRDPATDGDAATAAAATTTTTTTATASRSASGPCAAAATGAAHAGRGALCSSLDGVWIRRHLIQLESAHGGLRSDAQRGDD